MTTLEGQVVGTTLTCCLWSGRERCGSSLGRSSLRRERSCLGSDRSSRYGRYLTTNNIVRANIVKPAAIELMGIDVELHGQVLIHLDIELLDAVLAEETEHATLGVLSRNFNDIVLRHPGVACTVRHSTLCWHYSNDSTC